MKLTIPLRGVCFAVYLLSLPFLSFSQRSFHVTGKVLDELGKPLANVTVQTKSTRIATTTGADGSFAMDVPLGNAILVFSFVGYEEQELRLNSRNDVQVTMKVSTSSLGDVIVVGYGTQKRANVTGAVALLKNDHFDERPITRVDQALVGQLAGVTVKQNTGVPGKAFSIQVRGSGSISAGNEPLYVIDGLPLTNNSSNTGNGSYVGGNPMDNINPDDIESIEVLKDAAAAAIYGSRASNGVVLITTKHGQSGKARINLNGFTGYNAASKKLPMLNGQQWIDRATEMINAAYIAKVGAAASPNDNPATRAALLLLAPGQVNVAYMIDPRWAMPGHPGLEFENWQDVIERNGLMQNGGLSVSGGSDAVKYFVSGNYMKQDGFLVGVGYKAYSARANVDINANKFLKFGIAVAPSYSITNDPGVEGKDNIFHQALSMSPVQEDSVGLYPNIGKNAQYLWSNSTNGVLGKLENNINQTKRFRTLSTLYGEWQILHGLSFRSTVNLDNTNSNTSVYTPYFTTNTQATRTFNAATNSNLTANTSGSYSNYRRLTFVNENTLTYNTVIHEDHSLNVLVGQAYNIDRLDQLQIGSVGGFTSSSIQTLNAAAGIAFTGSAANNSSSQNVLLSYFSRVQYAYKRKYLLSASLRTDGSSRFGVNNQYGVFPSASLGWRINEEDFMKGLPQISDLKIRASYGVNGNNNIGDYDVPTLGSYGYVLGASQAAAIGQAPNVISNPDLKWEKSQTYDLGFDFGILNNRITGSFDYYNKLNTQLLLNVPVPEATGLQFALRNAGSVRNIGEELQITSRNLVGHFEWSTSVNVSHNSNKIVSLYGNQNQIIIPNAFEVSDNILRVGSAINSIYVVRQIGILTQDDMNKGVALYGTGETVGDPKYQDYNNDGIITESDKQIVGHPNPTYIYGLSNQFHYKGFDLSVLVQGQTGGSIYSLLGRAITRTGQGFTDNAPEFYNRRWRSPSDPGDGRVSKAYSTFGFVANTDWLYSSDYFRVRNITLGYNLKNLFKTSVIQGARIYVTAENFFGHDKYYGGLNPEAANTTVSSITAYPEAGDYGGLPLAKSLIVGLNITF